MRKLQATRKAAAALLALTVVGGAVTVAATQGSQTDPLVTLSYLTDVLTPSILAQVDEKVEESRQAYLDELNASVTGYTAQMEETLGSLSGTAAQSSAAFLVVDLAKGQQLIGSVGCEIMLRVGSANCTAPSSPGLIDSTDGAALENGKPLVKNHLYMVTITERGVTAAADAKLLVRGSYTIS